MARTAKPKKTAKSTATIGFEAKLWQTADKLRGPFVVWAGERMK